MTKRDYRAARALLYRGGNLLVLQAQGENFAHLPGGGLEGTETPLQCVMREVREEVGRGLGSLNFRCQLEHDWEIGDTHETTYLYSGTLYPDFADMPTPAIESWLTARWVPWWMADRVNLQPRVVYPWLGTLRNAC